MIVIRAPVSPLIVQPWRVKFWNVVAGLYFWEFITNFGYEWQVIRGHRPYRWTIWVYSLTRVSTLVFALLTVIMVAPTSENCEVMHKTQYSFACLAFASASLLVLLRIIAIWNHQKAVVRIAICLWVANIAFVLQGIIRVHWTWIPEPHTCLPGTVDVIRLTLIVNLITDIILLVIVLVGLFNMSRGGDGLFGLQGVLWKQGVIWLALAAVAEVPPVVLIILNLGVRTNLLLQFPSLVIMSIAATRMHHSLVDYACESTEITSATFRSDANPVPKRTAFIPITLDRAEVSAHRQSNSI